MARTAYAADKETQDRLFGEGTDLELYSAAQVTDILAADFERYAEVDAEHYLGG